ncbi:MAG TPA: hypothetical protein VFP67_00840 [Acidimicrobiia bacterium]|nr:hypothetical protein [Acidimicrobiia bacterium]
MANGPRLQSVSAHSRRVGRSFEKGYEMGLMDTIKGWFGGAKEQGADMAQKAEDFAEDAVDTAREKASDVMDSAKDKLEG